MKNSLNEPSEIRDQTSPQAGTFIPMQAPRGISRRAVLSSIAGMAAVGVAGAGIALLASRQTPQGPSASIASTPTVVPGSVHTPEPTLTVNPAAPGSKVLTYTGHTAGVNTVAWSPISKLRVASGGDDNTVQLWNPATGETLYTYHGHTDKVDTLAWSPNGVYIASGGGGIAVNGGIQDHRIQVWKAATGQMLVQYAGHTDYVAEVRWSPNGKYLATASYDKTVQVWEAMTGRRLVTYTSHTSNVLSLSWSPDGKRIVSTGSFNEPGVQVWDAMTGATVLTYRGHASNGIVLWVDWSPDGKYIASSAGGQQSDSVVKIWNVTTGQTILTYTGHVSSGGVGSLPQSNAFAARTDYTGRSRSGAMIPQKQLSGSGIGVFRVAWSPDGKNLISSSGSPDFVIKYWNMQTGNTLYTFRGHTSYIVGLSWALYGTRFASASSDQTVQVWQV